jgi:hypothetical protein
MKTRALATAMLLILQAGASAAATIHYYRFESDPGFLEDSAGSATLVETANPQQVVLRAGPGWKFRGLAGGNAEAADLTTFDRLWTTITPITGDFTVEVFVHLDVIADTFGDVLVCNAVDGSVPGQSWTLQVRTDGFGGAQFGELGLGLSDGVGSDWVLSGIVLAPGTDYYVATSFDLAGGQVTFYIQNLSQGGPLQVVTKAHSRTSLNSITGLQIGGIGPLLASDGLFDEVRISDTVLPVEDLLIAGWSTPIPAMPEWGMIIFSILLVGSALWLVRRRTEQESA